MQSKVLALLACLALVGILVGCDLGSPASLDNTEASASTESPGSTETPGGTDTQASRDTPDGASYRQGPKAHWAASKSAFLGTQTTLSGQHSEPPR